VPLWPASPVDGSAKVAISYADIRGLEFSGKDTAAGTTNIRIAPEEYG
jgi:hypothetical protein